ncbi:S8 family serine peptidase [Corynebacterium timonense]|uniref:Membrane-anchored mycosin MYCP n=1 Tax=Corynebacterium timonense TaxID=441500 RepID=A0A1H1SLX9_9CORY|nr:S8 family serine peptidase [Corynebacterium timonense]SDS48389.1 membrane-anchored mycosin MYCP [Corynebacterium timonense]
MRAAALAACTASTAILCVAVPSAAAQDVPCAVPAPAAAPAAPAWTGELRRFATGAGVRVAVIDTGVSPNEELPRLVGGADLVSPDAPNPLFDCDGHGTVVAGIIAARTVGVAPGAEILAVRQTSAHYRNRQPGDEVEASGSVRSLAQAIHAALDERARVINVSVVSCVDPRDRAALDASELEGALSRAEAEGAVVVAAAGNVGPHCAQGSAVVPSHFPTVLAVGARDSEHTVADFSVAAPADAVPVSAAGTVEVGLSWAGGGFAGGVAPQRDAVTPFVGTSFAAPVVAGTAALLIERYPHLTPGEVRALIAAAAQPSGGAVDPLATITFVGDTRRDSAEPLAIDLAQGSESPARGRWAWAMAGLTLAAGCAAAVAGALSRWRSTRPRG